MDYQITIKKLLDNLGREGVPAKIGPNGKISIQITEKNGRIHENLILLSLHQDPIFNADKIGMDIENIEKALPGFLKEFDFKSVEYFPIAFNERQQLKTFKLISTIKTVAQEFHGYKENLDKYKKAQEAQEAERAKAIAKLKERTERRKKSLESRSNVFENLNQFLTQNAFKIESRLEDEYINITLENGVKVRLQAEAECILLSGLEYTKPFKINQLKGLLERLAAF